MIGFFIFRVLLKPLESPVNTNIQGILKDFGTYLVFTL